jgi:uncharacterized protein (TIGR02588 family)
MSNETKSTPRKRPRRPKAAGGGGKAAGRSKAGREKDKTKANGGGGGTSPWEWAVAAVGGLILAAIVGFLVYEAIARPPQTKPEITATGGVAVKLASGTFLVPITVKNAGHETGAGVTVSGALIDDGDAVIEESAVTFAFVPQHSRETGGLYFSADPGQYRLEMRVEGYTDP